MENINLIRKIAWDFHKSTGLDWNDLFQEAVLAYLESIENYDEKRGAISTYVWHYVESRLKNYLKQEKNWVFPLDDIEIALKEPTYQDPFWQKIPENIEEQVNIILKGIVEMDSYFLEKVAPQARKKALHEAQTSAKITMKRLLRHAGYNNQEVYGIINELEVAVGHF